MNTTKPCPECGASRSPDDAEGACPRCLMAAALSGGAQGPSVGGPPAPEELAPHFPDLEIIEILGQGGMGVVYKARQKRLNRVVALKVLSPDVSDGAAFNERFTREARALARLSHPNIVGVHEFGESDGLHYLILEFVEGANLRQAMAAGEVGPKEALAIVPQICDALQFAHDHGVVHRDIKPENVLIDRAGRVKIADFGLAKLVETTGYDFTLTRADQVMGTPHYMAPEQVETPTDVDHRADIFSLGVVFYEMLTGELPLGRFPPPSRRVEVDVRLDHVVLRALEKERDRRYQRADDIKTGVNAITSTPALKQVRTPAPAVNGVRQPRKRGKLSKLAVAGALCLPAAFLIWLLAALAVGPVNIRGLLAVGIAGAVASVGGIIVSIIASIRIAHSKGGLRGQWFAIPGMVLPLLLCPTAMTTTMWAGARRQALVTAVPVPSLVAVQTPGTLAPDVPIPLFVITGPVAADEVAGLRSEISQLWQQLISAREQGHSVDRFYAVADADRIARSSAEDAQAGKLGLPHAPITLLGRDLSAFQITRFDVAASGRSATVAMDATNSFRARAGENEVTFPMRKVDGTWYFGLGQVERTNGR